MKICARCLENKPFGMFYADRKMRDGYSSHCKQCREMRRKVDAWKYKDRETKAEKAHRSRYKERANALRRIRDRAKRAAGVKARRDIDPKRFAWMAVANAKRRGKLVPSPCEICGSAAQAHHEDYSRYLDVHWLCPDHHSQHHRALVKSKRMQDGASE